MLFSQFLVQCYQYDAFSEAHENKSDDLPVRHYQTRRINSKVIHLIMCSKFRANHFRNIELIINHLLNKMTSRRAHFVWSHIVCFSYCWSVQLWICTNILELYDFNMASVFDLSCSTGWSNSKISSENYTNTAESISNEQGVLIPHAHCLGSAIIAFSVVQTRHATSTNTPKIWYLGWNTE